MLLVLFVVLTGSIVSKKVQAQNVYWLTMVSPEMTLWLTGSFKSNYCLSDVCSWLKMWALAHFAPCSTQELMSAAMGINTSSLEDLGSTRSLSSHSSTSSSSFTVVQALVSLLTQGGWHARLLQAQLSGEKCEFRHCLSGGDSMRAHVWALPHTYMHANTRTHHTPHNTCNTHTHIHTHTHHTHTYMGKNKVPTWQ